MSDQCPRCDQGVLFKANIKSSDENVLVCDECEALWPAGTVVSATNFKDMTTYLSSKEVEGRWDAVKVAESNDTA